MKSLKNSFFISFLLIASLVFYSCRSVPVTGRNQLSIIPSSELMAMSFQQYDTFLKENKLSKDAKKTALIKKVGQKIQKAVEQYMAEKICQIILKVMPGNII